MTAALAALRRRLERFVERRPARHETCDITPGWQERAAKLRQLIRECKHDGGRKRNEAGREFCAICARYMDDAGEDG